MSTTSAKVKDVLAQDPAYRPAHPLFEVLTCGGAEGKGVRGTLGAHGSELKALSSASRALLLAPLSARIGDHLAPDPRAARAYKEVNKVYATLTTFTGPLFHSMADGLQGLERAPGPARR
jgi:hypothetical protein